VRALLAITARELRERWTLPVALFVWGFAPLLLVRYVDITARPLATIAALATALGVALLMGGSVIARDLGDGRLAFFFARPVPWWSIAGGKLLAALLMAIAAPIAGILPTLILDWNPAKDAEGVALLFQSGGLVLKLALLVALVCFGHVAMVVYRARSTWAAVDFVLLGACAWGGVWFFYAFKRLGVDMSIGPATTAWQLLIPMLLVAAVPLAATIVQVAAGRSDLRRGHRALSLTFWAGALAWVVALGGMLLRERAVTPSGIGDRWVTGASSDGHLVGLAGSPSPGRFAAFVLEPASGRWIREGMGSQPAFSSDGRHAAWVEEAPFWRHERRAEVQLARFDGPEPAVESIELETRLEAEGSVSLALSPRADRLAVVHKATLSVHELPSGRMLASTTATDGEWMAAAFLEDGELRAFRRVRAALGTPGSGVVPGRVEVVTTRGGAWEPAIRLDAGGLAMVNSSPAGDLVLFQEPLNPRVFSLHDVRSGRRLRTFAGEDGFRVMQAQLLADSGVALIETLAPNTRLRIAHEGRPDRVAPLPPTAYRLSAGPSPEWLAVGCGELARGPFAGSTLFFSADTAEPGFREEGLLPTYAGRLFVSEAGELLRLDPETHARKVLLPAPQPAR
jgi:hypothetical protein